MGHEVFEGWNIPDTMVFFEILDLFAVITLVVFAYNWYVILKSCVPKKTIMREFAFE